jgi:hypothetical protein
MSPSCKHIPEFLKQSWNSDENSFGKLEKIFTYITNVKKCDKNVKIVLKIYLIEFILLNLSNFL